MNGLLFCADAAVLAGQVDIPTLYGNVTARLGDIPLSVQCHVPQCRIFAESVTAVLALQCHDFHVTRQDFISQHTADSGNVDISFAGGNGTELNIVSQNSVVLRAKGSNMDAFDIVVRFQIHNFASQCRVTALGNPPFIGANG